MFNVAVRFVSDLLSLHLKLPESPEVKHPLCNAGLMVRLKEIGELQFHLALSIAEYRIDTQRFCHAITNALQCRKY